ncbi:8310_t:CDS:2 [Funneliformis geosporum]|nr:8310_t:CDS:2 [Funneliformis geosporum]
MAEEYLPKLKTAMNDDAAYKSEGFEDKETELKGIIGKVKVIMGDIDDESAGKAELEKISGFYDLLAEQVILEEKEEDIKKKLAEAIADPSKFKDIPTPSTALDKPGLQKLLGNAITVDDTLLGKFKIDNKTLSFEDVKKILDLVGANHESKNDAEFKKMIGHLTDKKKIAGTTDEEKTQEDEMKASSNIDLTKYSGEEGLKKYLLEKYLGKAHEQKPTQGPSDPTNGDDKDKGFVAHLGRYKILYSCLGIGLAGVIGATIYF